MALAIPLVQELYSDIQNYSHPWYYPPDRLAGRIDCSIDMIRRNDQNKWDAFTQSRVIEILGAKTEPTEIATKMVPKLKALEMELKAREISEITGITPPVASIIVQYAIKD